MTRISFSYEATVEGNRGRKSTFNGVVDVDDAETFFAGCAEVHVAAELVKDLARADLRAEFGIAFERECTVEVEAETIQRIGPRQVAFGMEPEARQRIQRGLNSPTASDRD